MVYSQTYPANQTFLPPLSTLQLAHNVADWSWSPLALACWHGRQPILAIILPDSESPEFGWSSLSVPVCPALWTEGVDRFFGLSSISISFHQSSSVTFCIPQAWNLELPNAIVSTSVYSRKAIYDAGERRREVKFNTILQLQETNTSVLSSATNFLVMLSHLTAYSPDRR